MFDVGLLEIVVVMIVALIVIGPDRLPEVARGLGKAFRMLRKLFNEFKEIWDGITDIPDDAPAAAPKPTVKKKSAKKNGRSKK